MVSQILSGSLVLILCSVIHAAAIVFSMPALRRIGVCVGPARPFVVFGLSAAYLVEVATRMLRNRMAI